MKAEVDKKTIRVRAVPSQEVERAAYYHWKDRGCSTGDPLTDWLAAEQSKRMEELTAASHRTWLTRLTRAHRLQDFQPSAIEHG